MAKPSKLLKAYERMLATEEEKSRLIPERLVTLVADKPWIAAVSNHSEARQAFLEAAIDFCRSEKARAPRIHRRAASKPSLGSDGQEARLP